MVESLMIRVGFFGLSFLILDGSALAQAQIPFPSALPADCKAVESVSACKSFNEMLEKQDPDILKFVTDKSRTTYACFETDRDAFIMVSFAKPMEHAWHLDKQSNVWLTQRGNFTLNQYSNGVYDRGRVALPMWTRFGSEDEHPTAETAESKVPAGANARVADVSIDEGEVTVSYSFENIQNTVTDYLLQIRRSTRRFVETYGVKGAKSQVNDTGYCAEY